MKELHFERLVAWKKIKELTTEIYGLTEKLPHSENFGLKSQIRRACVSVSLNLAEGSGRIAGKDQANFYKIAYGSLMEVAAGILIAEQLKFIASPAINELRQKIDELARIISALHKSSLSRHKKF